MAVALLLWVVCAGVAGWVASMKGRSVGGFALAGLLFGPLGVAWAALAFRADELALSETDRNRRASRAAWLQQRLGWPR
jgi:hypothetical protein